MPTWCTREVGDSWVPPAFFLPSCCLSLLLSCSPFATSHELTCGDLLVALWRCCLFVSCQQRPPSGSHVGQRHITCSRWLHASRTAVERLVPTGARPPPFPPCCPADKGHQALAELLAQTLRAAARNVAAAAPRPSLLATLATVSVDTDGGGGSSSTRRVGQQLAAVSVLPPPMIPGNADAETTLCAMQVMGSADTCHAGQQELQGMVGFAVYITTAPMVTH